MLFTERGSVLFQRVMGMFTGVHTGQVNLGNGTLIYEGLQAPDPPQLTLWVMTMYGGLVLSGEQTQSDKPEEVVTRWWIITGPPEVGAFVEGLENLGNGPRRLDAPS